MKNKWITLFIIPALLSSCSNSLKLEFVPFTDYITEQKMMRDIDNPYFYSREETLPVVYKDGEINDLQTLFSLNRTGKLRTSMVTTGERKILVVPVYFSDSDTSTLDNKTIFIQNAFFGDTKRTEYESVASYYNKSSYGQLRITGEVAPWFSIGVNSSNWKSISSHYNDASTIIAEQAVDYIKANNLISDLSSYDTDGDGVLDAVYVIYDHPFDENGNIDSFYWAYVYYGQKDDGGRNTEAPYLNAYGWSSVNFITDVGDKKDVKSYTNYLIHECGHLLGLYDYYNTVGSYQPTGLFDMMDYNIGDHSSFSKYLMKWTSPYVVKPNVNFTYDLEPFSSSGEYFLIPSESYAKSPFGEYLLLEYFTPEGLNKNKEQFEYTTSSEKKMVFRYPDFYGLKIYHVNANLGYYEISPMRNTPCLAGIDDPDYLEKIEGKDVGIDYMYSNSPTDSQTSNGTQVLYHLLESSGNNTLKEGTPANNNTLFRVGDDFGITKFTDFTFSDGSSPNLKLKIKAISSKRIRLEISTEK